MSKQKVIDILKTVLDADHAKWVWEHRDVTIKKKLTERAAQLLCMQFDKCPDPNAAADEMIERGWRGFKAEWISRKTPDYIPYQNTTPRGGSGGGSRLINSASNLGFGFRKEQPNAGGNRTTHSRDAQQLSSQSRYPTRIDH